MDSIKFSCTNCKASLEAQSEMKGKTGKCPECGETITVPNQEQS